MLSLSLTPSSINFCEADYVGTSPWGTAPYLAERWNSLSSLIYCLFALWGMKGVWLQVKTGDTFFLAVYLALHSTLGVIGLGSFLLHGCLCWIGQVLDELPMCYLCMVMLYFLLNHDATNEQPSPQGVGKSPRHTLFFLALSVLVTAFYLRMQRFYIAFMVTFSVLVHSMVILLGYRAYKSGKKGWMFFLASFVCSFLIAVPCWWAEHKRCNQTLQDDNTTTGEGGGDPPTAINLHIVWHVFTAVAVYLAFNSVVSIRYSNKNHIQILWIQRLLPLAVPGEKRKN